MAPARASPRAGSSWTEPPDGVLGPEASAPGAHGARGLTRRWLAGFDRERVGFDRSGRLLVLHRSGL